MVKSAIKVREKRISDRKPLTGLLPGKVLFHDAIINAKPSDISVHGLGLVVDVFMQVGEQLELRLPDKSIFFKVAWIKPDFGKHDLWRVGLMSTDSRIDVERLFKEHGCIK